MPINIDAKEVSTKI